MNIPQAQAEGKLDADAIDPMTDAQRCEVVLKLFGACSPHNCAIKSSTVSTDDIRPDLEFFDQAHLFSHLDRTGTSFGKVTLARRLSEPTDDLQELQRRQAFVKALVDDEALFELLDNALSEIKKSEPMMLSFFSPHNDFRQGQLGSLYNDASLLGKIPGADELNKNENYLLTTEILQKGSLIFSLLNAHDRVNYANEYISFKTLSAGWAAIALFHLRPDLFARYSGPVLLLGTVTGLVAGTGYLGYKTFKKLPALMEFLRNVVARKSQTDTPPAETVTPTGEPAVNPGLLLALLAWLGKRCTAAKDTVVAGGVKAKAAWSSYSGGRRALDACHMAILTPLILYTQVRSIIDWRRNINYLQQRFMHLARAVKKMRTISLSLLRHKDLMNMTPEALPLVKLFNQGGQDEDDQSDMQRLLTMLDTGTFKGKPSFFSHFGRIAAINKIMDSSKYEWVEIFEAIGYLDVYLSTAKLIKECKNKQATFCFPDYVTSLSPILICDDFWNPLMDAEQAIPNSIALGDPARNIILTGPNTGGKSTVIKGVMLTSLCAQTLGIAPARSCKLTPFSAFNTYIRVADDVSRKLSLFAAEAERAKLLKTKIERMPRTSHSLTIIDEMYRGTAPSQAALLSFRYAKELAEIPNNISLFATHYPELIELEKETGGACHNYKVEIEKLPDGSLKRNYKLLRGWTTQNVAYEILKEARLVN